jgi:hypothetical protein
MTPAEMLQTRPAGAVPGELAAAKRWLDGRFIPAVVGDSLAKKVAIGGSVLGGSATGCSGSGS